MSILTERYRPKTREEIAGNKEVIDRIFALVNSGSWPHLIFEGPAGVGKTTTALVIARTLFGEHYRNNFLELNASDERRIDDVRGLVKTFCKTSPLQADYKILLLDESDEMTSEAQNALRRLMEKYSDITKFIFCVNHVEKLIDPIRSRCEVFRFGPISIEDMDGRLSEIYAKEKDLTIQDSVPGDALRKIAELAHGDMRRALNHLQVLLASGEPLNIASVESIKPTNYGKLIYDSISIGRFLEARKSLQQALELGYTERFIVDEIHKVYIEAELSYTSKAQAVYALAECDYRLTQGVNEILAIDKLLFQLMEIHDAEKKV